MSGDPLAALRPLHLPEPVGWWPPAPGWWLLALLVLALALLVVRALRQQRRRSRYRRAALAELAACARQAQTGGDALAFAASASGILRRAALQRYPRARVAALCGDAWLGFLEQSGGITGFRDGAGRVLGDAVYRGDADVDIAALEALCRRWLKAHR
ncbi:MAG: DUF4381 domain-containing protein [Gammaproteobacteria bacterium]